MLVVPPTRQTTPAERVHAPPPRRGCSWGGRGRDPATLWRQGGVNLLVNAEPEGFAHSAWVTHGTGVSEVGLMVPDARAVWTGLLLRRYGAGSASSAHSGSH